MKKIVVVKKGDRVLLPIKNGWVNVESDETGIVLHLSDIEKNVGGVFISIDLLKTAIKELENRSEKKKSIKKKIAEKGAKKLIKEAKKSKKSIKKILSTSSKRKKPAKA